jgi:hypothetical protein
MPWLSFLIPIAYIPGVTGAALATGWAVMSAGLPIVTWRGGATLASPLIPLLAIAFLTYAGTSLAWVDNPDTALSTLWQYALMAGAFYAGTQTPDLRRATIGLALGFGVSSLLCIPQALGLDWIVEYIPCRPSGLMFNPIILGEGCAITMLLCLSYRLWWLVGLLIPGLLLSQSRGAFLALAIGLVLTYCRPQRGTLWSLAPIWTTCSFSSAVTHDEANDFRWMIWRVLYHFLDFWGHGAGSVEAVIIRFRDQLYSPGYAHNEFLDLAYQYGVGALPAVSILLAPALNARRLEWPSYVAFLTCCLFSFPLHCPPLAFLGMVVAGHLARDWSFACMRKQLRGPWALPSLAHARAGARGLAN